MELRVDMGVRFRVPWVAEPPFSPGNHFTLYFLRWPSAIIILDLPVMEPILALEVPISTCTFNFYTLISIHSLKNKLREFGKRPRHFTFSDHSIISQDLFSWLCINSVGRKLMLITLETILSYGHTGPKKNLLTWCQDQPREVFQALFVLCKPQVCNLEMKPSSPQIQQELGILLHLCKDIPVNRLWYAFQYDTWQYFLTKE